MEKRSRQQVKLNQNGNESNYEECTASASASTANLGPGYDIFGLGLDVLEDIVTVKIKKRAVKSKNNLKIIIKGDEAESIPKKPEANTSGLVAKKMIADYNLYNYNFLIEIEKNIPAGYGMGSSAASAVATAVSIDSLFEFNLDQIKLMEYSAEGELASAGVKHYDNISGAHFGNFVIVKAYPKLDFINIKSPKELILVVCVPTINVPKKKTEISRAVLPKKIPLQNIVYNMSNACSLVAGFYKGDVQMICDSINDCIIEPYRKKMIPGYDIIKNACLQEGAMAFTISGAGPSTIAFMNTKKTALHISKVMREEHEKLGIGCKTFLTKPSSGSRILSLK